MTSPHGTDSILPLTQAHQQRVGLSLLLTGRADGADPAVDHFLHYARENRIDTSRVYGLTRHDRIVGSVMFVSAAGKVSTIYASPPGRDVQPADLSRLVQAACRAQDPSQTRLVQAILDPWQIVEEQVFTEAGFKRLATLDYQQMGPTSNRPDLSVLLPPELTLRTWSEQTRPLFEQAILGSYIQTLDCPALVGVRHIDDIIAGHQAAGVFTPGWWFVLSEADSPAGVMLLAPLSDRSTVEVVYLGLCPAYRGRKLGEKLVRGAEGIAFRFGYRNLSLAVDEHNPAAVQLYKRLGFRSFARKVAMIMVLDKA